MEHSCKSDWTLNVKYFLAGEGLLVLSTIRCINCELERFRMSVIHAWSCVLYMELKASRMLAKIRIEKRAVHQAYPLLCHLNPFQSKFFELLIMSRKMLLKGITVSCISMYTIRIHIQIYSILIMQSCGNLKPSIEERILIKNFTYV